MKKLSAIVSMLFSTLLFSQVVIGGSVGTATNQNGVLLDFAQDGNKGILLPYTEGEPANATGGTIIFDVSPNVNKIKVKNQSAGWRDLSIISGENANVDLTPQPASLTDKPLASTSIGSSSPSVDGVLVLDSTTKAMVLPVVNSYKDIVGPSAGMMVFENSTKRLAVYNGTVWTFWKP